MPGFIFNHCMRLRLIINPISGTRSKAGLAQHISNLLSLDGIEVDAAYTTCRGDATRIAHQSIETGYDGVLACGGDGTVNETARALCGTEIPLGIIPAGSGNGLARHLNIPIDIDYSLRVIKERNIRNCDFAVANGTPFFCTFGLGFDAAVSHQFAKEKTRGLLTYIKSAIDIYSNYTSQRYTISIDGREPIVREAFLVACCNASQYGNNAFIAPEASITDGKLDVIIVKDASRLRTLLVGLDMMTGMIPHNSQTEIYQASKVTITRDSAGECHIDGEATETSKEIDVECIPGQLKLFCPTDKTRFRPFITPISYFVRDISLRITHTLSPGK